MDITPFTPRIDKSPEQCEARIRWMNARIAAGGADIDAGNFIDLEDLEDWFERLETDPDASLPAPKNAANIR